MDDFDVSSLHESRNEWSARLTTLMTPLVIDGFRSILDEAFKLCKDNNETDKYLMTFQNFVSRIPKWNSTIIENERKRICDKSGCMYLEDLVTCVHIIQLKILTAVRVGQKQKKIDINVPKLDDFIHKSYVNIARKVYKNVYLFEIGIPPLQIQKHNRELEIIVQECILNTIRETIPVEAILKAYMMDETVEEDVIEEIKEQIIEQEEKPSTKLEEPIQIQTQTSKPIVTESKLKFDDNDYVKYNNDEVATVSAPKTLERLTELEERKKEEDSGEKISISDQSVSLSDLEVHVIGEPEIKFPELSNDDIEFELLE
jgi:hypothetical protein